MVNTSTPGRMNTLIRQIKDAPKAKGAERIWLPGEKEWEYREDALVNGMALPQDVRASLQGLAEDMGIEEQNMNPESSPPQADPPVAQASRRRPSTILSLLFSLLATSALAAEVSPPEPGLVCETFGDAALSRRGTESVVPDLDAMDIGGRVLF